MFFNPFTNKGDATLYLAWLNDNERILRSVDELSPNTEMRKRDDILIQRYLSEERLFHRLDRFAKQTGMSITQHNGERVCEIPADLVVPQMRGRELYVSGLPQNFYEPELFHIFKRFGIVTQIRMMITYDGGCRGFAYLQYRDPEMANEALRVMHKFRLHQGENIAVRVSIDNRVLFVGGVPIDKCGFQIKCEMDKLTDGVHTVHVPAARVPGAKNPNFVFVEYISHRYANYRTIDLII